MSLSIIVTENSSGWNDRVFRPIFESALKDVGIQVLPGDQLPRLAIHVDLGFLEQGMFTEYVVYAVTTEFVRQVTPVGDPKTSFSAAAWGAFRMGFAHVTNRTMIPADVRAAANAFAQAYKENNSALFSVLRSPLPQLKSTDLDGLRALRGKPAVVVGRVVGARHSTGRNGINTLEYDLEGGPVVGVASSDVARFQQQLGDAKTLIGQTIAVRVAWVFLLPSGQISLTAREPSDIEFVR